mmetsp:Transcript_31765/g.76164  ORF Transcript_31765/g.76164 Transcript_31765/m.76164 type:complete len:201 (+) Transcript_31765:133-735(+)
MSDTSHPATQSWRSSLVEHVLPGEAWCCGLEPSADGALPSSMHSICWTSTSSSSSVTMTCTWLPGNLLLRYARMRCSLCRSATTAKGLALSSSSTLDIARRHFLAQTKHRVDTPRSARLATSASDASVLAPLYPTQNTMLGRTVCAGSSALACSASSPVNSTEPRNCRAHKVSCIRASVSLATLAAACASLQTNLSADKQ